MKHVKLFAALLAFVMLGACTESPEEGGGFLPSWSTALYWSKSLTLIKPLRKPFRSRQRKHGLQPSKRRRARNLRGSVCPPTAAMPAKRRSPSKSSNPTALPNRASPKSRSSAALTASPSKSNKRDTVQTIRTIQMIQMIQTRLRPITNTSPGWITNSQTTAKRERRRPSRNHSTTTEKTG